MANSFPSDSGRRGPLFWNLNSYFERDFDLINYDSEFRLLDESFPHNQIAGMNGELCDRLEPVDQFIDLNERVSLPDSLEIVDLLDRGNQASYVMDLFHQRVEQPQIIGEFDLALELNLNSAVIEENEDLSWTDLKLGLGLGLGFGRERHHVDLNDSSGIRAMDDDCEREDEDEGCEPFFNIGLPASVQAGDEHLDSNIRLLEQVSYSDEENGEMIFGLLLHSESENTFGGHFHEDEEDDADCPLSWDWETNEGLEWEEVGPWVEEEEALSITVDADDSVAIAISPITLSDEELIIDDSIIEEDRNMGWQVLFDGSYLERNLEYGVELFGDSDDFADPVEYEVMVAQIEQNEMSSIVHPATSKAVIRNLPTVVMTQEDADKNDTLCAICKDCINVGEHGKRLPCKHVFHGDCIFPWLDIQNTCPVCRYELPTDDADYEQQRRRHAQ